MLTNIAGDAGGIPLAPFLNLKPHECNLGQVVYDAPFSDVPADPRFKDYSNDLYGPP